MAKTTIDFSEPAAQELDRMAQVLSTTKAEVIRNALSLYSFLLDELNTRRRNLAIVEEDNEIKKVIVVPGVQRASTASARS